MGGHCRPEPDACNACLLCKTAGLTSSGSDCSARMRGPGGCAGGRPSSCFPLRSGTLRIGQSLSPPLSRSCPPSWIPIPHAVRFHEAPCADLVRPRRYPAGSCCRWRRCCYCRRRAAAPLPAVLRAARGPAGGGRQRALELTPACDLQRVHATTCAAAAGPHLRRGAKAAPKGVCSLVTDWCAPPPPACSC